MTTRKSAHLIAAVAIAIAIAGCGSSPPARFYTLDSTAVVTGAAAAHISVIVGPVTVPASVNMPQMVVQVGPNRVDVEEFNRWEAPLEDNIADAVAGDLVALLGTSDVTTAPLAGFRPDYRVIINVQRFDSALGKLALVEAMWTVRNANGGEIRSGRTVARESPQGAGYEALAAAHSRALAVISGDIAAAIRAESHETY
ncbi:MAG: PqiC family protein [Candidatus Binataceae bacterium]